MQDQGYDGDVPLDKSHDLIDQDFVQKPLDELLEKKMESKPRESQDNNPNYNNLREQKSRKQELRGKWIFVLYCCSFSSFLSFILCLVFPFLWGFGIPSPDFCFHFFVVLFHFFFDFLFFASSSAVVKLI